MAMKPHEGMALILGIGKKPGSSMPPPVFGAKREMPPPKKPMAETDPNEERTEDAGKVSVEQAGFHGPDEKCANCTYFEPQEQDCSKVNVDFQQNDPDRSHCELWKAGGGMDDGMGTAPDDQTYEQPDEMAS